MFCPHIMVFDSGLGGLSIVDAIRQQMPNAHFSYLADNARFPYGLLSEDELVERVCSIFSAHQNLNADIAVVACNTASTAVLTHLRNALAMPVVGVVPAIKPAAKLSQTQHIGLLATPATVSRPYTDKLIEDFAQGCTVHRLGSAELVRIAEGLCNDDDVINIMQTELKPWLTLPIHQQIDTVVLGCTHFPLIKPQLQKVLGRSVSLVDSGHAVAKQTVKLVQQLPVASSVTQANRFYSSLPLTPKQLETIQLSDFKPFRML